MAVWDMVWDRQDVLPSATLCGGMGGVKKGSIFKRDGKYIICALTVESVESVCQTHRLNNPSTPRFCRIHVLYQDGRARPHKMEYLIPA